MDSYETQRDERLPTCCLALHKEIKKEERGTGFSGHRDDTGIPPSPVEIKIALLVTDRFYGPV